MKRRPKDTVSFNMSRIRGKNTKPEVALRRALHAKGLRFRLHASLPGKPDIVFVSAKIAVFVDGEFWHGRNIERLAQQLHVRREWWLNKIRANVERDRRNDAQLRALGYRVVRVWDRDVLRDPDVLAARLRRVHQQRARTHAGTTKRGSNERVGTKA
jgi:DNA mismatch endonuclease, patch repair protein